MNYNKIFAYMLFARRVHNMHKTDIQFQQNNRLGNPYLEKK